MASVRERPQRLKPSFEAHSGYVLKVAVQGESGGNIEMGKGVADLLQPHVATLSNGQSAGEHIGRIFEHPIHLAVILDVKTGALELHAVGVLYGLGSLNADHYVLRMGVILAQVMTVVGRHQWQAKI